jgi:2-C-methyl-D-erythritol 4-phosphate cytidylyltransferase/2-C-methyl-D-erythritol 2,4-cyclodiphosphate synthase
MKTAVIITAAGRGTRAGGDVPKQWQVLAGKPVLEHTIAAFSGMTVVLVLHPDDFGRAAHLGVQLVAGGADRAASVRAGLEALADRGFDHVLIHDGARPLISGAVIARILAALAHHRGAAPAVAVTDALWRGADGLVAGTENRDNLYRAQTPQGFDFKSILDAHRAHSGPAADDVAVARAAGIAVAIVNGDEDNIKLTYAGDFARAEAILRRRGDDT